MPMLLASESGGVSPVMSVLRSPWGLLLCWLLVINLVTFLVFGLDKWKAKRKEKRESVRRVPERTLFLLSAIGGNVTGDGFADMAALSRLSGRAAPENLASLRSLPVRHTDVINRADLTRYVSDILSNGGFDSI